MEEVDEKVEGTDMLFVFMFSLTLISDLHILPVCLSFVAARKGDSDPICVWESLSDAKQAIKASKEKNLLLVVNVIIFHHISLTNNLRMNTKQSRCPHQADAC